MFKVFCRSFSQDEFALKRLCLPVTWREHSLASEHDPPPAKNIVKNLFEGDANSKFKYREEMTKYVRTLFHFPRQKKIGLSVNFPINSFSRNIDRSTLTEEQLRSLKYIHKVCKCKRNVRKHRCRKCEQCKAPKCGKCRNCLNPPLKQACSGKVCLFPIIPNCPCFR